MVMIKIAIVDDETIMHDRLREVVNQTLLSRDFDYRVLIFDNPDDVLSCVKQTKIDIVLLDIELGSRNGVELAKRLSLDSPSTVVVFITSYEGYIKDAFGLNVYDYILKQELDLQLPEALIQLTTRLTQRDSVVFKFDSGILNLELMEIVFALYENRNITIFTQDESYVMKSTSLTKVYESLPESMFIQPNSRYIVNMMYIQEMRKGVIKLKGYDDLIEVSRGQFKNLYQNYLDFLVESERL
ncbi:DNA-binding response regulator [Erysipelothrix rhusiopathiae]|nr:DNA-binding response regulator [Erysipelothrix rhusiopathiae]